MVQLKDSGERREFDTGAVRDIQEGKGRCDLMPLDVCSWLVDNTDILHQIELFKVDGDKKHLRSSLLSFSVQNYTSVANMLLDVSRQFEDGAAKYGENNWQKGIPVNCYIDSAVRHYLKYLDEWDDEPHDKAFVWNMMCAMWTCSNKPELNPYKKEGEK